MSSAAEIARILGGHRAGDGYLVRCPVAGHGSGKGDRNPSLLVKDGDTRLLVKCFAGCSVEDILHALCAHRPTDQTAPAVANRLRLRPTDRISAGPALSIWKSATTLRGTVAETYLRLHRRLSPPFPPSLRFATSALPSALVAAVQLPDDTIAAVQLTYLASSGRKADVSPGRRTVGGLGDGAVRLGIASEQLGLAEGVEDALAALQLSQVPCWASLGAGRMHRVAIPCGVRELHIFADDDGPGRAGAERTADKQRHLGRLVVLRLPPQGFKDWAEVVQRPREAA